MLACEAWPLPPVVIAAVEHIEAQLLGVCLARAWLDGCRAIVVKAKTLGRAKALRRAIHELKAPDAPEHGLWKTRKTNDRFTRLKSDVPLRGDVQPL